MSFLRLCNREVRLFLALIMGLAGCEKAPEAAHPSPNPAPPAKTIEPVISKPSAETPHAGTQESSPPAPPKKVPGTIPLETKPSALAQKFRESPDPQDRGDIAGDLWTLDTPESVETIRQLFLIESDTDVKASMVAGLAEASNPKTRDARYALIVAAITPGQPKDVREVAVQTLMELQDPRALSLLQHYTRDTDPDIREAAREALGARNEADQP